MRERIYPALFKKGSLPYALSYLAKFYEGHDADKFAGNLVTLKTEYANSSQQEQSQLSKRFIEIVDNLVLQNGVTKTTHFKRQNAVLANILGLGRIDLEGKRLRVLEVPSSIGIASLGTYDLLSERYVIDSYTLGDLCLEVYYDRARECVFDDVGNLLQFKDNGRMFTMYRPHTSGNLYNSLISALLSPLCLQAWVARRKFQFDGGHHYEPIRVLHPEVEERVRQGVFRLQKLDVFVPSEGEYELILCFNLLQRNYFSQDRIDVALDNLKNNLSESGILIVGNDELFCIWKRVGDKLVIIERNGEF